VERKEAGNRVVLYEGRRQERKYLLPQVLASVDVEAETVWFRVQVNEDATCSYAYSLDGNTYNDIGGRYKVEKGIWIGAKVGIFCLNPGILKSSGYADFDFFSVAK